MVTKMTRSKACRKKLVTSKEANFTSKSLWGAHRMIYVLDSARAKGGYLHHIPPVSRQNAQREPLLRTDLLATPLRLCSAKKGNRKCRHGRHDVELTKFTSSVNRSDVFSTTRSHRAELQLQPAEQGMDAGGRGVRLP